MGEVWHHHAGLIAAQMPPLGAASLGSRLSAFNRQRKLWMGLAAGRGKYRTQRQVRATMRRVAARHLAQVAGRPVSGR